MKSIKNALSTVALVGTCLHLNASATSNCTLSLIAASTPYTPCINTIYIGSSNGIEFARTDDDSRNRSAKRKNYDCIFHEFLPRDIFKNPIDPEAPYMSYFPDGIQNIPLGATFSNPIIAGTSAGDSLWYVSPVLNTCPMYFYGNEFGQASDDVIFKVFITGPSLLAVSTCDSDFDTYLYLLNSSKNIIASNDDYGARCNSTQASLQMGLFKDQQPKNGLNATMVNAGTYYIVAEGYNTRYGNLKLLLRVIPENLIKYSKREAPLEDASLEAIAVVPDQTGSSIHISIPSEENAAYTIYDTFGKMVRKGTLNSSETNVDLHDFASGIYMVSVIAGNMIEQKKIEILK